MKNENRKVNKIGKVITAWETLAPEATFATMTLEQFKAKLQPFFDQQNRLSTLHSEMTDAREQQEIALTQSHTIATQVVSGVKADPAHGEDSALYAAMGYIRKSNRRSGLSRKAPAPASITPLAKAA